jgi:hypothetical protein
VVAIVVHVSSRLSKKASELLLLLHIHLLLLLYIRKREKRVQKSKGYIEERILANRVLERGRDRGEEEGVYHLSRALRRPVIIQMRTSRGPCWLWDGVP